MSIMQEYQKIRNLIGHKKYDAIEDYINEKCPKENYDKYKKELNKYFDSPGDEWLKQKEKLEEKYGIIFLSDVLYKPKEWEKFEKWYNENKNKTKEKNEEMKKNEQKDNRHRELDNGMYVMDLGYRGKEPIALVERTFSDNTKEYIVAFNYEIKDNKINWGYGYYYSTNIDKAKEDFDKVLAGGNLADTFKNDRTDEKTNEEKKIKNRNKEER